MFSFFGFYKGLIIINMENFQHDKLDAVIVGREFKLPGLKDHLTEAFRSTHYREASRIELGDSEAWVFDYGVIVFWGASEDTKQSLLQGLQEFVSEPLERKENERYRFELNSPELRVHKDVVSLTDNEPLSRLAVSHAFAQSMKLSVFEDLAQNVIEENASIPSGLSKTGKILVSRKELAKKRGLLFGTKSDILLHFNLLDTPEFFWDYPELEPLYHLVARYLEVLPRVNLLQKKLETIHELLDMLAAEQNHKHSSFLEWIIILLIAFEIVYAFWH